MTPLRSRVTPIVVAGAVVCLVACAAYASTVNDYFLNDDFGVVALLAGKPATYFPRWFVTSWMDTIWGYNPDEIRPFPALSYQLTALPNAASPLAHHLLNIVIHAANGLLVLALARTAIGLSVQAAAIAALVFVLLPVQAESVAWITGRVDSLPALFYLGSVLAYVRWRRNASALQASASARTERLASYGETSPKRPAGREGGPYLIALALGFMALFSKQNTITLAPALLFYDLIVERRWPQLRWSWIWPYLPFTAITLGYLYLRYVLFGQVVRESLLTADGFAYSLQVIERHAWRTIFGHASAPSSAEAWIAIALLVIVACCAARQGARMDSRLLASAVYFVPVWWLFGIAPVLVAGYDSPRHAYLAAVAWAVLAGVAFQWTWTASTSPIARASVVLVTAAILGWYAVQLSASIGDWNRRALISSRAARDIEREALAAPEGTLLIVGAPASLWEWAVPFVARPPFASTDLTVRTLIVSPRLLYCCRGQWEADTRSTLEAWRMRDDRPLVVALRWNEATGALMRLTDREDPDLRSLASYLAQIPSGDDLDRIMTDALTKLVRR